MKRVLDGVRFKLEKNTKNTIRYREESNVDSYVVGALYVQKRALSNPAPREVKVSIEAIDEG